MKNIKYKQKEILKILEKFIYGDIILFNENGILKNSTDYEKYKKYINIKKDNIAKKSYDSEDYIYKEDLIGDRLYIPCKDGVVCILNEKVKKEKEKYKSYLIDTLPAIAKISGGEAILFDNLGTRLLSINEKGEKNKSIEGTKSEAARKAMLEQRPNVGRSNIVAGAKAVRIPINKDLGIGFNNESDILKSQNLINEVKKHQMARYNFTDIIGNSKKMIKAKKMAKMASDSYSNVLLFGETGTGKELFAQSIHNNSERRLNPFIAINCAAIPLTLMEGIFFGHEPGAFTGARKDGAPGVFEQANGGTIFLDEISEMNLELQSKVLRVLQEKEVRRIGGEKDIKLDIRVISASNKDLEKMYKEDKFRQDLYYRLNVLDINLPSLREIREDIPLFIEDAINKMNVTFGKFVEGIDDEALEILMNYNWPGNIRELMNCVEKTFNIIGKERIISKKHLPANIKEHFNLHDEDDLDTIMGNYEKQVIIEYLNRNKWNRINTAKQLNISKTTLWRRMEEYGINETE